MFVLIEMDWEDHWIFPRAVDADRTALEELALSLWEERCYEEFCYMVDENVMDIEGIFDFLPDGQNTRFYIEEVNL